jgi:glutamate synthase (ferredoxin)
MPRDFKRMVEGIERAIASGLSEEEAQTAAFEANVSDAARVSGS